MSNSQHTATELRGHDSGDTRVYEFRDFVPLKPGELYIQVHQCRTVFHPDGSISKDVLPTATLLEQMIHAFHGKVYQSAGTLNAFFEDLEHARECARAIFAHHGKTAEICGTQISIPL
ncbi:MAG: hypothetical protein H6R26_1646 [Proteobacteria bacterium]|nr:hypothetical protein [Pseudomonadota bacterium]